MSSALTRTMFWTGALIALMPVALGLIVVWVVLKNRGKAKSESDDQA